MFKKLAISLAFLSAFLTISSKPVISQNPNQIQIPQSHNLSKYMGLDSSNSIILGQQVKEGDVEYGNLPPEKEAIHVSYAIVNINNNLPVRAELLNACARQDGFIHFSLYKNNRGVISLGYKEPDVQYNWGGIFVRKDRNISFNNPFQKFSYRYTILDKKNFALTQNELEKVYTYWIVRPQQTRSRNNKNLAIVQCFNSRASQ